MLPDWMPNIHPLIVHFPIALLVIAVLFDAVRLVFKKASWLHKTVLALYTTGSIGLIAAFLTGRRAVETVSVTGDAIPAVTSHEDWALYTLIYFLVFTAIRFVTWWKELEKGWVLPVLIVPALVGTGMLWYTGELGAKLVRRGIKIVRHKLLHRHIPVESGRKLAEQFRGDELAARAVRAPRAISRCRGASFLATPLTCCT